MRFMLAVACFSCFGVLSSCESPVKENDATSAEVARLVQSINENSDLLHADYSPSVHKLCAMGMPALRNGALELLVSPDPESRMRGQTVLGTVVMQQFGFVPGQGWSKESREREVELLWEKNGSYAWNASESDRDSSYKIWRAWVKAQTN